MRLRPGGVFSHSYRGDIRAEFEGDSDEELDDGLYRLAFEEGDEVSPGSSEAMSPAIFGELGPIELQAFEVWSNKFARGIDILRQKTALMSQRLGGTGWEVSIMACPGIGTEPPEVCFVYWVSAFSRTGRKVELDDENKSKWPTPAAYPLVDFTTFTVVAPVTGHEMRKQKAARRVMPPDMVILRDMWRSALLSASGRPPISICWGCERDTEEAEVFECALCLCAWHTRCVFSIADAKSAEISARCTELGFAIPPEIARTLCHLCLSRLGQGLRR
jgi:hypothetical protein